MKKNYLFLFLGLFLTINVHCSEKDSLIWKNLKNAIEIGTSQFINFENYKYPESTVFVIKVISINKNTGVFSISYIVNDFELKEINPSHYLFLENKLVLIRTDIFKELFTLKTRFPQFNEDIKSKAKNILAGDNHFITGQSAPVMIFQYKRKKVTNKYYKAAFQVEEKYLYYNDQR